MPSHRSASVSRAGDAFRYQPTAVQALVEVHATPANELESAPVGLGVVWIAQVAAALASTSPPDKIAATSSVAPILRARLWGGSPPVGTGPDGERGLICVPLLRAQRACAAAEVPACYTSWLWLSSDGIVLLKAWRVALRRGCSSGR